MAPPDVIHAGYLPLLDSAVLVVAARFGFAERHGIDLRIHRERSWAAIRDRMSVGHFDCAQMLAPMPIAISLSHGPLTAPTFAPMVLNTGGNAVTVGNEIAAALEDEDRPDMSPAATGAALRFAMARLTERNDRPMRFAVVHRFSCHNYDLRYWLAASGIRPDRDVDITIIPPSLMPEALASGQIDGFSAGEPWNTIAVRAGAGEIVATKAEIAPESPEKVLGTSQGFIEERPEALARLIHCLLEAGAWCDDPQNHGELARLVGDPRHVAVDSAHLMPGLTGKLEISRTRARSVDGFLRFVGEDGNSPRQNHAVWIYRQMLRWGHSIASAKAASTVAGVFRPDFYGAAIGKAAAVRDPNETSGHVRLFDDGLSDLSKE